MLSTKKILSVGVGIASMAGVMAMSTAPVAAAEGTIEVVTHAGAGGGTDVNSRMMMIRTRRHLKQDMVVVNKRGGGGAAAMQYFKSRPADGNTVLTFTVGKLFDGLGFFRLAKPHHRLRWMRRGSHDFLLSLQHPIVVVSC